MDPIAADPEHPSRAVSWITIRTYLFEYEAVFARDLLRTHGLGAQILDAGFIGVAPHMANSVGGVRLQVDARDEEEARMILAAPYVVPDSVQGEEEDDEDDVARATSGDAGASLFPSRVFGRTLLVAVAILVLLVFLLTGT